VLLFSLFLVQRARWRRRLRLLLPHPLHRLPGRRLQPSQQHLLPQRPPRQRQ